MGKKSEIVGQSTSFRTMTRVTPVSAIGHLVCSALL
jgi:hypothetical protein